MTEISAETAYNRLRDVILLPKNKRSLDILKMWYSEEDAKVLAAGPFKVVQMDRFTVEEYAEKSGLPIERVMETFDKLSAKGLIFWFIDHKNGGKKKYMIPPLFPGLVEYFIISPNNPIDLRRKFVKKFHEEETEASLVSIVSDFSVFRVVPGLKPKPGTRKIEIDGKLEPEKNQVMTYQDIEEIVHYAGRFDKNIAVLPCTCRTMAMMMKKSPECEGSVENCLVFGSPAQFSVEEGIGRYIDVDETMDILKQAEKEKLVHTTLNTYQKQSFICNCCTCCCGVLETALKLDFKEFYQESDWTPIIDHDKCNKCRKCIKACGFNALTYRFGTQEDKSEDRILVREEKCAGCGVCASNCPNEAMNLKKIRDSKPADSFIDGVMKMMAGRKM